MYTLAERSTTLCYRDPDPPPDAPTPHHNRSTAAHHVCCIYTLRIIVENDLNKPTRTLTPPTKATRAKARESHAGFENETSSGTEIYPLLQLERQETHRFDRWVAKKNLPLLDQKYTKPALFETARRRGPKNDERNTSPVQHDDLLQDHVHKSSV